jgi:hypothetical protein
MSEDLTIRLLMTDYKIDTPTNRHLFAFDTFLKLASLFLVTACLWALLIQRWSTTKLPTLHSHITMFHCRLISIVLDFPKYLAYWPPYMEL